MYGEKIKEIRGKIKMLNYKELSIYLIGAITGYIFSKVFSIWILWMGGYI